MPVTVNYWDGSSETYGEGTPEVTVTFKEAIPMREITRNASIALGEATWMAKLKLMAAFKS